MPQRYMVVPHSTVGSPRWNAALAVAGLGVVTAAGWCYLAAGAGLDTAMHGMDAGGLGMTAMAPTARAWTPGYTALMLGMWAVMMTAMMLPSAAPAVVRVVGPADRELVGGAARATWFAAGYLAIWAGFGAAATGFQWALDAAHLLTPAMAVRSAALGGLVVALVGIYQLTPLKRVCLERCRTLDECLAGGPDWGARHAAGQGLRYGLSCLGCCAGLMNLLFVGGVMNMVWAGAIAVWVLGEKILPWGGRFARLGGIGLIAGGAAALAIALVG